MFIHKRPCVHDIYDGTEIMLNNNSICAARIAQ